MNTFKNNLKATLYYDMTASDTVIWLNQLITSSDASTRLAAWPTCDATHTFTLTLASTADSSTLEVVECTGVTANTADYIAFTCTRAKEGTTAIAHGKTTTTVENRLTAAALTAIVDAIASVTTTVTTTNTRIDTLDAHVSALSSTILGSIQSILATDSYIPNGCAPANGAEYTRAQFPTLYDTYLVGGKLLTCTYTEFATQITASGNCAKFAVDTTNQKFKVPCLKDGDSITQAASASALGKSVKAGLPNITAPNGSFLAPKDNGTALSGAIVGAVRAGSMTLSAVSDANLDIMNLGLNASNSNAIYGNSTTVTDEQIRLRHFVVVASAQNNASAFDWSNYMAALAGKANVDLSNATGNAIGQYFYARDEKPSGTSGGSATGAAWNTRDLNTVKINNISGVSLASNRVTLPAGKYYIRAQAPAAIVGRTCLRVYDTTNSAVLLDGPSMWTSNAYDGGSPTTAEGGITLAAQTVLELRMYAQNTNGNGFGWATAISGRNEIYSEFRAWKM